MIDPVEHLARDDKWQLAAGDGTLFAPSLPLWLDVPGFWDEATVADRSFGPLFTVAVLDDSGHEIPMRPQSRRWTPADVTLQYRLGHGITATEVRTVHPGGVFVSEWRFVAYNPVRVHLVAWTAQPGAEVEKGSARFDGALSFRRTVGGDGPPLPVNAELAYVGGAASWSAIRVANGAPLPQWSLTPFVESWHSGHLPGDVRPESDEPGRLFFAAVHRPVDVQYEGASATIAMRLLPVGAPRRLADRASAPRHGTFTGASRSRADAFFNEVPRFSASDPYLEHAWWYRWYLIRLSCVDGGGWNWEHLALCEGPGKLHRPSARSAVDLAREVAWLPNPVLARATLRTVLDRQLDNGDLPANVPFSGQAAGLAPLVDWGAAVRAVDRLHRDDAFVRDVYPALAKYAARLQKDRDPANKGLFEITENDEGASAGSPRRPTGTEKLLGVDATTRAYTLLRLLERIAVRSGEAPSVAGEWRESADRVRDALRERLWHPERECFVDLELPTRARSPRRTPFVFLPFTTDLVDSVHVRALERHLLDPRQFWTDYPPPSLSIDDKEFSAEGESNGVRGGRPWNGRTYPAVASDMVDALARGARTLAPHLRELAAEYVRRFVRMFFESGDLKRLGAWEHYNALTGHGAVADGMGDVPAGRVVDLIMRHVIGLQVQGGNLVLDPLPFGLEHAEMRGVKVCGRTIDVAIAGDAFTVTVDGEEKSGSIGKPLPL